MNPLAITCLAVGGCLAVAALVALLTHRPTHLDLVDGDGCLCCGPTDHRPGR